MPTTSSLNIPEALLSFHYKTISFPSLSLFLCLIQVVMIRLPCYLLQALNSLCSGRVKWSEVAQWCLTLCYPMDCSLPGFSIHGIFQARVLEWVAITFSRGSPWPRDWTQVSCIAGRCFTLWATRETLWSGGLCLFSYVSANKNAYVEDNHGAQ